MNITHYTKRLFPVAIHSHSELHILAEDIDGEEVFTLHTQDANGDKHVLADRDMRTPIQFRCARGLRRYLRECGMVQIALPCGEAIAVTPLSPTTLGGLPRA